MTAPALGLEDTLRPGALYSHRATGECMQVGGVLKPKDCPTCKLIGFSASCRACHGTRQVPAEVLVHHVRGDKGPRRVQRLLWSLQEFLQEFCPAPASSPDLFS